MDYTFAAIGGISCKIYDDIVDNNIVDNNNNNIINNQNEKKKIKDRLLMDKNKLYYKIFFFGSITNTGKYIVSIIQLPVLSFIRG
jgi:hypothetical protein